ncbi:MAG: amidase family protein [Verrucomicrobia bacterium]|nr:amidase family protein [Verrucomicrobiota bacterium]
MISHLARSFAAAATLSFASLAFAATLTLETATIPELQTAMAKGALTSEKLVSLSLARAAAYDDVGPKLNAFILINPKALAEAKALDAERKAGKLRGPLHGIPVILKDNHNTSDMPTTGGSVFLEGSIPPADAFIVKKLREAGAVILAKSNLSEFASSAKTNGFSSLGGQTLNPHDLTRGPAGSSGGSGSSIAAWYAPLALGTDTGGSIRNPCAANGIAGLKPTRGLLSRAGVIPLGLSFDTSGPMARSITDVAVALGVMTGLDPADPATATSAGKSHRDYTRFLDAGALKGARLGVLVDYAGTDEGVKKAFAATRERLTALGASLVEIKLPAFILERQSIMETMRPGEFKAQVADYLSTLKPGYPRTLAEMISLSEKFTPKAGQVANPSRWAAFKVEQAGYDLTDPVYLSAAAHGPALIAGHLEALLYKHQLDAFIYPTNPTPAQRLDLDYSLPRPPSATSIANITGFPDVIVPAGATAEKLPVTLSFMGSAYSEPRLLALAYAFEQATHARITPSTTPALAGESLTY